ncbi:MAG: response regulator, partial [Desulforhopalus sp.]
MKIKALVVDNNPVVLKMISSILEGEGCEVRTAETGLEALEILESYHPDIVFTDLIMPRVSGEQLCRIIRSSESLENIFIVVVSAILVEDRERILREVNCNLCIAKGNVQETRLHVHNALVAFESWRNKVSVSHQKNSHIPKGLKPSAMARELLSEKYHLSKILGNLEEGIFELSHHGKIVSANNAALKILGIHEEKILGMALADIADWREHHLAVCQWVKYKLADGGMETFEIYEDAPFFHGDRVVTVLFVPVSEEGSIF